MNRPITALFAALEALLVVGIGLGIPLVPLTLLWAFQYGLQVDWTVFWRASVDTWLVGHGADLHVRLDPVTAITVGFPDAGTPFVISIAALGFALLTALLAVRAGRRIAETPHHILGVTVAVVVFAALSFGVTLSAVNQFARPSIVQGTLWPTGVFLIGLGIGALLARKRMNRMPRSAAASAHSGSASTGFAARPANDGPARTPLVRIPAEHLRRWWDARDSAHRAVVGASLRGGVAAASGVVAVSAVLLAVMTVVNYAHVIALYERIHAGAIGGIALTLGQAAFLPNFVVWVTAWLVGPGFAVGTGSSVSPLGTVLGPIPSVPIFGALPTGDLAFGFLGLLVPVVIGFLVAVAIRPSLLRALGGVHSAANMVLTGVGIGLIGGATVGLLAWASGGAAGPGRLTDVGPDALQVGLFAALEFAVPAILGLVAGRRPRNK